MHSNANEFVHLILEIFFSLSTYQFENWLPRIDTRMIFHHDIYDEVSKPKNEQ